MASKNIPPWYNAITIAVETVWPAAGSIFTTKQLEQLAPAFSVLFPENNTLEASMRREIQHLEKGQALDMVFRQGEKRGLYRRKGSLTIDCSEQEITDLTIGQVSKAFGRVISAVQQAENSEDSPPGRDSKVVNKIKEIYDFTCQICSLQMEGPNGFYAECAHIRQLNGLGQGADNLGNVLCLCPNDHKRLDKKILAINSSFEVVYACDLKSRVKATKGDVYAQLQVIPEQHQLDIANLAFQYELCFANLANF